ncbi:hypothetical protein K3725_20330 (plasmid) [Leisingera sp. S132]|uniref:hypothetical protein n=1 Tax=Leisingera sp. S132 TaxID=2867016 RepID=UPI0021A5F5C1|nr:hypothetical protein [Leisingera sp. S132]UWQ81461.1 hypothetical protein K3725_20330 [Leisingera sp. S132]
MTKLEPLTPEVLRKKLGFELASDGGPSVRSIANAARECVQKWRSPTRARVTRFLNQQLLAASFDEDFVRDRVTNVLDTLIETGDLTKARFDGKHCLVLSRTQWIKITDEEFAFLGHGDTDAPLIGSLNSYVRRVSRVGKFATPTSLFDYMGLPGHLRHFARRTGTTIDAPLSEFWSVLCNLAKNEGQPIDADQIRAVVDPPGSTNGFFGRHDQLSVSGRWKQAAPEGVWCAVRPGRNQFEWHPIILSVGEREVLSLDLYDWDEWCWSLLARGRSIGIEERSYYSDGTLSFEHPIPTQFRRLLSLIGEPGEKSWTWRMSLGAENAFSKWRGLVQ